MTSDHSPFHKMSSSESEIHLNLETLPTSFCYIRLSSALLCNELEGDTTRSFQLPHIATAIILLAALWFCKAFTGG